MIFSSHLPGSYSLPIRTAVVTVSGGSGYLVIGRGRSDYQPECHDSFERASSISPEKAWHAERTEYGEGRTGEHERKRGLVPVLVPEPGSLSLLLLGLAAIGFLARRRGDLPTAA